MGQNAIGNAIPTTRRVVVIRKNKLPLPKGARREAGIFGLIAGVFFLTGLTIQAQMLPDPVTLLCMAIAGLAWPIWKLRRNYRMIADTNGASAIGFTYSLGFASALFVGLWYNLLVAGFESTDPINLEMIIIAVAATIGSFLLLLIIATTAFMILWRLIRLTLPRFITQDGALCPNCAYCLIGVQSMRCPECGNEFAFADLETTEHEFASRAL